MISDDGRSVVLVMIGDAGRSDNMVVGKIFIMERIFFFTFNFVFCVFFFIFMVDNNLKKMIIRWMARITSRVLTKIRFLT